MSCKEQSMGKLARVARELYKVQEKGQTFIWMNGAAKIAASSTSLFRATAPNGAKADDKDTQQYTAGVCVQST